MRLMLSKSILFSTAFGHSIRLFVRSPGRSMSWQSVKEEKLRQSLDERRNSYKCGSRFVTLDQIETWDKSAPVPAPTGSPFRVKPELNSKISVFRGDITTLEVDVIVNAANSRLAGGGGVDGAIHSAAGPDLLHAECRSLNGCATGDVKLTGGYNLPAKYIMHTVGPVGEKESALESCYSRSLNLAVDQGLTSIAFPCIATGVYGYPNHAAGHVALKTVRHFLEEDEVRAESLKRIIFCLFLDIDVQVYSSLLPHYFPTTQ